MNTLKLLGLIIASALIGMLAFQLTQPRQADTNNDPAAAAVSTPVTSNDNVSTEVRPAFSLPDLQDQQHNIDEWDGKLLLINFWASWCPPCIIEMPDLDALRLKYQDNNFEILGIALEPAVDVSIFLEESPVSYPILYGDIDADRIARDYGNEIGSIPFSALINSEGIIIKRYFGEINMQALEQTLLSLI